LCKWPLICDPIILEFIKLGYLQLSSYDSLVDISMWRAFNENYVVKRLETLIVWSAFY